MGLFKNVFGSSEPKEEKVLPWQALTEVAQLAEIEKQSQTKTQVIFKHSTTCGISKMAMKQFVSAYNLDANLDLHYLDLLSYREVSNEVGYKFQVIHQSPQLVIIKNGTTVGHASHGAIGELDLETFV
ncbi:bacillithiol system redox-active protein YtxJ [Psychroserpens burtonensis]|uniref:Bacillithiol system redox-active protein YtxJ n=1 Tax=Psychroserpens burtonensis TaxID=49278 RepID=A0A5C7BB90_9FLAO|nr:bacillithiol system redox-active protein YtxJ [Psychroserpens burtonensis]TXE17483.1 bacillithiol system redox-active protein YtxJ [Psychroserpens burtonensis]